MSHVFQNKAKIMGKLPKEAAFKCPAAKLYNFCSFCVYVMLLNLVHKLKCETNLTLLST